MQPWKKRKGIMRPDRYVTKFDPIEREVIGDLTATVSEAIIARAQSAPKDELAEMMGIASGHKEAPEDPALARLFPDFEKPGDEEYEGDNSLLRSLHENDIARAKLANLQVINAALGPTGGVEVSLEADEVGAFLAGLNDMRLFLSAADLPGEAMMADREAVVEWLAFAQDSLLEAFMG